MKLVSMFLVIVFFTGCTTFRPVGPAPSDLQGQRDSRIAVQPGEKVKIVTDDGNHYEFKVVDVTDDYIEGGNVKAPVSDIVSIETKKFSGTKTVFMVAGTFLVLAVIIFAIGNASVGGNLMAGPQ